MRTTEPIVGRLAATDIRLAPARIPVQWPRYVEAEVIFKMGEDLPARNAPYTAKQVAGSLCAAFAGIEVCTSRFVPDDVPLAHLVADNSNAELLIVGESFPMEGVAQLADLPVTLARRGEPLVHGSTTHVLGQPLFSVTWLANWLAARGEGLERGQWVATGSCTGIVEATTDDLVVARLGTSAQAIVEFFPQSIHGEGES
jgi:2-keto-4-pentenoate hydratase